MIGVDGRDPYQSLFDPYSTERESFCAVEGVIDETQEVVRQFDLVLNQPPSDILVSHTGFPMIIRSIPQLPIPANDVNAGIL